MNKIKGMTLCAITGLIAYCLGNFYPIIGGPVFAILIGMVLSNQVTTLDHVQVGIQFTSKKVLQFAVILLGFSMNVTQVIASGRESLPVIVSTITTSLIVAYCLTKALNLEPTLGTLIGVGSSICGGSAIAATAPVIEADNEDIAKSISVIFLFNVIAALIFPTLGEWLGLTNQGFGLFAGSAINDTSSVTAAASSWDTIHSSHTLEIATVVKLTRTLAIIPITMGLSIYHNHKKTIQTQKLKISQLLPPFIVLFIIASITTSVISIPDQWIHGLKNISKFCITMAMAAIGFNTHFKKLLLTGGNAIIVGFSCWLSITLMSLFIQYLLGLI